MKFKKLKKAVALTLSVMMILSITACGNSGNDAGSSDGANSAGSSGGSDSADRTETITVTMGRQTLQNSKLPEGDTYEDNAYIRMAEAELNIDIVDEFEANGEDYDRQVSLALTAGEIPDIMKVVSLDELKELYENDLIADLTEVYNTYASDNLKEIYDSYGGRAIDNVTFDGKIMSIPATNADSGPSIVWVRSDWMDSLGITIDTDGDSCITIEELENLAKTFMEKNPAGVDNVVGIALADWLTSGDPDGTYSMNSVAYALNAFPKTWYEKNGQLVYGSTTEEMRETLRIAARWYQEGILDPQVGVRTWDDITSLLANGQTGITFGTWHIPDWLLNNIYAMDPSATFKAYAIETADGKVNCKHNDATAGYMVVSKKFDHPEIVVELANLFYDRLKNEPSILETYPEVAEYQTLGVDGSTRPMNIEINSYNSLLEDFAELQACLNGEITLDEVKSSEEKNNATVISAYLEGSDDATGWAKYHSRLGGVGLIQKLTEDDIFQWLTPVFPQTTSTMETNWANLEKLEAETFIKIVTGTLDVDEGFDQYVTDWNAQGGQTIISEISEQLQ